MKTKTLSEIIKKKTIKNSLKIEISLYEKQIVDKNRLENQSFKIILSRTKQFAIATWLMMLMR